MLYSLLSQSVESFWKVATAFLLSLDVCFGDTWQVWACPQGSHRKKRWCAGEYSTTDSLGGRKKFLFVAFATFFVDISAMADFKLPM